MLSSWIRHLSSGDSETNRPEKEKENLEERKNQTIWIELRLEEKGIITWSTAAREKPRGSGTSREEGDVELSLNSTAHLRPTPPITPFPFSIPI